MRKLVHPPVTTLNMLKLNDTMKYPAITICRKPAYKTSVFPVRFDKYKQLHCQKYVNSIRKITKQLLIVIKMISDKIKLQYTTNI